VTDEGHQDDLEPIYATISEITDNMDDSSSSHHMFHQLVDVFDDLAALPDDDDDDDMTSPPPPLTDTPAVLRGSLLQPVISHGHTVSWPRRVYTYC